MNKLTTRSVFLALLLHVAVDVRESSADSVIVAEDRVEWATANGDALAFAQNDATAHFFIRDDALETVRQGTRVFTLATTAVAESTFNIAAGTVTSPTGAAIPVTATTLTAPEYDTAAPADTPLADWPNVRQDGIALLVTGGDFNAGTFTLFTDVTGAVTPAFSYHGPDVWEA